jgi:hypothetical protein
MIKNSTIKNKIFCILFLFSISNVGAEALKEGAGVTRVISGSSVMLYNGQKVHIFKGSKKIFLTGSQINSLSGKVSLSFKDEMLNVNLEPKTKLILNKFQFNQDKAYIEIFIIKGEANFKIPDKEKVELLVRTHGEVLKI